MTRLIDVDAVMRNNLFTERDRGFLLDAPTIDAVEVVMCGECKYAGCDATTYLVCNRKGMGLKPYHVYHDDYCSYGERREDGEA